MKIPKKKFNEFIKKYITFLCLIIFIFQWSYLKSQSETDCCKYIFKDLGNFPSNVGGVNIKIGKQKSSCGSAQDQSFKLIISNNTDYQVVVSGYFYAITTCGRKVGLDFVQMKIGPKGQIMGSDIFIYDNTGLTNAISKLDCKGVPVGCPNNNLIEDLGVEKIVVEYPQFDEIRKRNQNEIVWSEIPHYRINNSNVKMKIGKQKAGNGQFQKYLLSIRNNSDKKIRISGTYFATSICGITKENKFEIDINPGDYVEGTGNHLEDPNGLTGFIENGTCQTLILGPQIENNIIQSTDVKNISITYLDENPLEQNNTYTGNQTNPAQNNSYTQNTIEDPPKKDYSSDPLPSQPLDRRVKNKMASDQLTATSLASFATMGAFILANDYGYTTYDKNKTALNLSLGIAMTTIPMLASETSDLDPSYTDYDEGGGIGFGVNTEYWLFRNPKSGLAGFYNVDVTSFSMVGMVDASSFGSMSNYGIKAIYGKSKVVKLSGELSWGGRTAECWSSFNLISFPNIYTYEAYGSLKNRVNRWGLGLFFDLTKPFNIDNEVSLGINYLTDKITLNKKYPNFEATGYKGHVIQIDFKMAFLDFYFEFSNKSYPCVGKVEFPYQLDEESRKSFFKIGILTGLTVFSTK